MATIGTLNLGGPTRPVSRLDALRRELIKAKHTSQTPPDTQSRESHTTPGPVDWQRQDSGASYLLDIEGTESVDGDWEADIDHQNIPALASALWEYVPCPCPCPGDIASTDGISPLV
ncbi:hypothetical protein BJX68DRAFT_251118 [Aspergillus pseudodeflectus]|uniref:Uncharacterized protein n=1 Tax=Aspergillus pseudodeflectus TaxID=176178 RepID=A0ABR4JA51_9EURO